MCKFTPQGPLGSFLLKRVSNPSIERLIKWGHENCEQEHKIPTMDGSWHFQGFVFNRKLSAPGNAKVLHFKQHHGCTIYVLFGKKCMHAWWSLWVRKASIIYLFIFIYLLFGQIIFVHRGVAPTKLDLQAMGQQWTVPKVKSVIAFALFVGGVLAPPAEISGMPWSWQSMFKRFILPNSNNKWIEVQELTATLLYLKSRGFFPPNNK